MKALAQKPFAPVLCGPRVVLRRADPKYTEELWSSIRRDRHLRGRSWEWVQEPKELAEYLAKSGSEIPAHEVTYILFYENRAVGTVHLHTLNYFDHKLEIGYAIEKSFEGRGLVSEAVQLAENEAKAAGFRRIELCCNVDNVRSRLLAERNGYAREGTKRRDCRENGVFRDTALYAKLLNEEAQDQARASYFSRLPRKRSAAGALIWQNDQILILKPSYKPHWLVPGGVVEAFESPAEAARRECLEELGTPVSIESLLCVDYKRGDVAMGDAIHFLFAATLLEPAQIRIDKKEIVAFEWMSPDQALERFDSHLSARVRIGLKARTQGIPFYCEDGKPFFQNQISLEGSSQSEVDSSH